MSKNIMPFGESKNIEFKGTVPKQSERYVKTIIAFANTQGGRLIIGIDDQTHEVVGVDQDTLFRDMDRIANAVSDMCEPQIVPDIEPKTIDGKTVICVTVLPGSGRPYYLRSKGKEAGTFIRVAGTTRPASEEKIKELEMEGSRISWDELTCVGYKVQEKAIRKLCKDIKSFREKAGLEDRKITRTQMINWKLLKEAEDSLLASNAFVLLTSNYFQFSKTQCAVFKGTERSVFLDKREYSGPLYEQIEDAVTFVLRNIRLGAKIDGLVRKESYELPVAAIREMIINAHCHRKLTEPSCVQVALYDDRLEVTSPGGLYNGLTYEAMMEGRSSIRNRAIANVFNQMGLVESWGTGIRRIMDAAKEYGLPKPQFLEFDDMVRVNLFRQEFNDTTDNTSQNDGETTEKTPQNDGETTEKNLSNEDILFAKLNKTQKQIISLIKNNPSISMETMAEQIQITQRNIEKNIKALREAQIIKRHGSPRGGYWEVTENK